MMEMSDVFVNALWLFGVVLIGTFAVVIVIGAYNTTRQNVRVVKAHADDVIKKNREGVFGASSE